jgi:hypothetical protein
MAGHPCVLDAGGRPTVRGAATHPDAPRLWFTGYTNPISGMFREIGIDAKRIARAVVRDRAARAADTATAQGSVAVSPVLDALRASLPTVVPAKQAWRR